MSAGAYKLSLQNALAWINMSAIAAAIAPAIAAIAPTYTKKYTKHGNLIFVLLFFLSLRGKAHYLKLKNPTSREWSGKSQHILMPDLI